MKPQLIALLCGVIFCSYSMLYAAEENLNFKLGVDQSKMAVSLTLKAQLHKDITQVDLQREDFSRRFNWDETDQSGSIKEYNQRMQEFSITTLKLKQQYYLDMGELENAATIESHINKLTIPQKSPSLNLDRNSGEISPVASTKVGVTK
jgi:hypothetical protein